MGITDKIHHRTPAVIRSLQEAKSLRQRIKTLSILIEKMSDPDVRVGFVIESKKQVQYISPHDDTSKELYIMISEAMIKRLNELESEFVLV